MSINPRHVFDAANDLRTGSGLLARRFGQSVFPLRSVVITAAFSAELYLKCLLHLGGKEELGHNLRKLFESLSNDLQHKIELNFTSNYSGPENLASVLDEFKDTFVIWRYIYEKQASAFAQNFSRLRALSEALHKTVVEEKPEWK